MSTPSPHQNPPSLGPDLTPRDAALDAVYRFVQGIDFNDATALRSAFTSDAVFVLHTPGMEGHEMRGREGIVAAVAKGVGTMATLHHVSNPRVRLIVGEGEGKGARATAAFITAYAMAQHFPPGKGLEAGEEGRKRYTVGNHYAIDLVRDEGTEEVWRIRRFDLTSMWADGDRSVMTEG